RGDRRARTAGEQGELRQIGSLRARCRRDPPPREAAVDGERGPGARGDPAVPGGRALVQPGAARDLDRPTVPDSVASAEADRGDRHELEPELHLAARPAVDAVPLLPSDPLFLRGDAGHHRTGFPPEVEAPLGAKTAV